MKNCRKAIALIMLTFFVLSTLTGCYAVTSMTQTDPIYEKLIPAKGKDALPPAYISSIQVKFNGAGSNVKDEFPKRFVGYLKESKIFSDVKYAANGADKFQGPQYDLVLHCNENRESSTFWNGLKGFFVGLTLYLFTPVLPMTHQYDDELILTVTAPNLQEKVYKSSEQASLTCTLYDCKKGLGTMSGQAMERSINALINQMVQDDWLRNNSKPK